MIKDFKSFLEFESKKHILESKFNPEIFKKQFNQLSKNLLTELENSEESLIFLDKMEYLRDFLNKTLKEFGR